MSNRASNDLAARTKSLLEELLPARGADRVSIERGAPWEEGKDWVVEDDERGVTASLRLIVFEGASIRDIKEQMVVLLPRQAYPVSLERLEAYLRGWCAALEEVLAKIPVDAIDTLMPHDLVAPKVLAVKSAKTADELRAALLVRSRLGRLISS